MDTLDIPLHGITQYTHALAFLLPQGHRPVRHPFVLPWYLRRRFYQPRGCRDCLAEAAEPYLRLHWRFAWMLTCPAHKRMLEPFCLRIPAAGTTQVAWIDEKAEHIDPSPLLMLDTITLQAITSGSCELPCGKIPGALWIRLLRTVLDELGV